MLISQEIGIKGIVMTGIGIMVIILGTLMLKDLCPGNLMDGVILKDLCPRNLMDGGILKDL